MRIIHEDSRSNDALWKQLSTEKEKEGVWGDYEVVSVEIGDQGEEATWGADRGGVGEVFLDFDKGKITWQRVLESAGTALLPVWYLISPLCQK